MSFAIAQQIKDLQRQILALQREVTELRIQVTTLSPHARPVLKLPKDKIEVEFVK